MKELSNQFMNNSLHKSIQILLLFTIERPLLSLKEISDLSGIPKSTAFRFLNTLEYNGLVQRQQVGVNEFRYKLGLKFLDFGSIVTDNIDIRKTAYPFMQELTQTLSDAVQLVVRDGNEAVYVEKVESILPVRLYTRVGRRSPIYAGACPRALMAFLPWGEIEEIIASLNFYSITSNTITSAEKLREQIELERQQGYTISDAELLEDTAAIAMPIKDYNNNIVASLSVAGVGNRFKSDRVSFIVTNLKNCVDKISKALGHRNIS